MKTWLGPVLALLGVVLTTGAACYQWRRTNRNRRGAAFHQKRAEVLQSLLAKLSDLQLALAEPKPQTPGPDWATILPVSPQEMTSAERYLQEQIRRSWELRNV
ncbi:hypothetical protein ACWKSP_04890 [Micromonosporaceae bacterium Da 78-11]